MESESLKEIDVAIEENPTGTDYCSCRLPEDLRELDCDATRIACGLSFREACLGAIGFRISNWPPVWELAVSTLETNRRTPR